VAHGPPFFSQDREVKLVAPPALEPLVLHERSFRSPRTLGSRRQRRDARRGIEAGPDPDQERQRPRLEDIAPGAGDVAFAELEGATTTGPRGPLQKRGARHAEVRGLKQQSTAQTRRRHVF